MDFVENVNDGWLKPRLLMAIVRERLPNDKIPLGDAGRLSSVLSLVRVHGLLSESHSRGAARIEDKKLAAAWSAAVDAWVERCLALCSNKMPDKCWAGISLLGVTCELCASDRFLASYSSWFQALVSNFQHLTESDLVKSASCASMSDFFTRLSRFPHVKKDATSLASKFVLPIIQLISASNADGIVIGAAHLLLSLLTFFPFSLHRHYEKAEEVIVSSLLTNKCSTDVSKELICCLSLLPSVRDDEDSWNMMMRKVLVSINMFLNQAFRGLEDERRSSEAMRLLVPPGNDRPPLLGGQSLSSFASVKTAADIQEVFLPRLSVLMQSCCAMITSPSLQVNLPVHSLIVLVERVLSVDGSLRESTSIFTSELHQEVLCAELPSLHSCSLDILMSVIRSTGSQLLPHAVHIKKILTGYLKGTSVPFLRTKVYSIMRALLIKMGVGMGLSMAENVICNAFDDLKDFIHEEKSVSSILAQPPGIESFLFPTKNKKRKQRSDSVKESHGVVDLTEDPLNRTAAAPASLQIAALETLEALVIVAGSKGAESWRREVDQLLISVARKTFSAASVTDRKRSLQEWDPSCTWVDFKLAALQALLASLLSYSHIRPPNLSQGLDLFHRGQKEKEKQIAAFCSRALLALEVLIHPRSISLMDDSPSARSFDADFLTNGMLLSGQKSNLPLELTETPLADDDNVPGNSPLDDRGELDKAILAEVKVDQEPVKTLEGSILGSAAEEEQVNLVSIEETTTPMCVQGGGDDVSEGAELLSTEANMRNSRSPSVDSLPDIVDADPDSD